MGYLSLLLIGVCELQMNRLRSRLTNCTSPGGFDFQFKARSSVIPIPVATNTIEDNSTCPVKAILMTNQSYPLAQCYPQSCIEECIRFCKRRNIHYISDEVYALTSFPCPEMPDPVPFVSVLSLDIPKLGGDVSRVHTVWSPSKDFGQSGTRMVRDKWLCRSKLKIAICRVAP